MSEQHAQTKYVHLEERPDAPLRQLYVKGHGNLTARHVVGVMYSCSLDIDQTAEELDLPTDVVRECVDYYRAHKEDIDREVLTDNAAR